MKIRSLQLNRFESAWQPTGGFLRLFQPLSFDLLQPSDIVEKAVHWGALTRQLRKADPDFLIYFILGKPSAQGHFLKAFDQARQTLNEETGGKKELVSEDQVTQFAAEVERQIKAVAKN